MSNAEVDSLEKAKEAIVEAAAEQDVGDQFAGAAAAVDVESLHRIVEIAWRYQFSGERHSFKKDIRELQEFAVRKMVEQAKRS